MRTERWCRPLLLAALAFAISGCATTYGLGQTALRDGRYAEAASNFQAVLSERPDRTDALVGLGIARYGQGAYDEAVAPLTRAVTQDPKRADAQLYLGLSYLGQGNEASAAEHLRAFRGLTHSAQVTRQVDDALDLMRTEHGLSPESRRNPGVCFEVRAAASGGTTVLRAVAVLRLLQSVLLLYGVVMAIIRPGLGLALLVLGALSRRPSPWLRRKRDRPTARGTNNLTLVTYRR